MGAEAVSSLGSELMKEAFRKLPLAADPSVRHSGYRRGSPRAVTSPGHEVQGFLTIADGRVLVSESLAGHTPPSPAPAFLAPEKKTFAVHFQSVSYFMLISPKGVQLLDLCY